jgi:uncharacterized protein (DUF1501 family)
MAQIPPGFNSSQTEASMLEAANSTNNDYKCAVCLFMFGATDSHNMVVPFGESNPNTAIYELVRQKGVRIEQSELTTTLLGTVPQWALHPSLSYFHQRWNSNDLAIIWDVGVLNEPTTKEQFLSGDPFVPLALFAHNVQQQSWQAAVPFRDSRDTGWFGRYANLVDSSFNPETPVESGILSVSGAVQQVFAYPPKTIPISPPTEFPLGDRLGTDQNEYNSVRNSISQLDEINSPFFTDIPRHINLIAQAFGEISNNSILIQNALIEDGGGWNVQTPIGAQLEQVFNNAIQLGESTQILVPNLPDVDSTISQGLPLVTQYVNMVKNVAKLIYSRDSLKHRRQAIFSGLGFFDHHQFLRPNHDPLLKTVDIALKAFFDAIDVMEIETPGIKDSVVLFTETDFGRTLRSNGTFGTDHAWSGHCFVMGKPVAGGLYGSEPDYTISGPRDIALTPQDSLGRFIPQLSIEQYYATILKWMDVPEDLLNLVLPALPRFSPQTLEFMG